MWDCRVHKFIGCMQFKSQPLIMMCSYISVHAVAILGGFLRFPETSQNWAGARARASS